MPDTELDGFEREGEGGVSIHMFYIHVYMSKTKIVYIKFFLILLGCFCLLYTSPSPRDLSTSRMPSSA